VRLRVARHTDRFMEIPDADAELELTTGGGSAPPIPHPESMLVLFCDDDDAQRAALVTRIGALPVLPENPYWRRHGIAFVDPDGFQLILALR
jgi:hypothetical protein